MNEDKKLKLMSKRAARKKLHAIFTKSRLMALRSCFETGAMTPEEVHGKVSELLRERRLTTEERAEAKALLLQTGINKQNSTG